MRHPYRTAGLCVAAVVLLTGCSTLHTFRLLLTVTNADDGQPVEDVTPVLEVNALPERKNDFDVGYKVGTTDARGRLEYEFKVSGYTSGQSSPWYLKFRKEGFEPQVIDINPRTQARGDAVNPVPVTVKLKPSPKKP